MKAERTSSGDGVHLECNIPTWITQPRLVDVSEKGQKYVSILCLQQGLTERYMDISADSSKIIGRVSTFADNT